MKIAYKKSVQEPDRQFNYILDDRMKKVMVLLDGYARLWRIQEVDNFKFTATGDRRCYVQVTKDAGGYDIACMKELVLLELKPVIENSKTAHRDGW